MELFDDTQLKLQLCWFLMRLFKKWRIYSLNIWLMFLTMTWYTSNESRHATTISSLQGQCEKQSLRDSSLRQQKTHGECISVRAALYFAGHHLNPVSCEIIVQAQKSPDRQLPGSPRRHCRAHGCRFPLGNDKPCFLLLTNCEMSSKTLWMPSAGLSFWWRWNY